MVIDEHKLEKLLCKPTDCVFRKICIPIYEGSRIKCAYRLERGTKFNCEEIKIKGPLVEVALLVKCRL